MVSLKLETLPLDLREVFQLREETLQMSLPLPMPPPLSLPQTKCQLFLLSLEKQKHSQKHSPQIHQASRSGWMNSL